MQEILQESRRSWHWATLLGQTFVKTCQEVSASLQEVWTSSAVILSPKFFTICPSRCDATWLRSLNSIYVSDVELDGSWLTLAWRIRQQSRLKTASRTPEFDVAWGRYPSIPINEICSWPKTRSKHVSVTNQPWNFWRSPTIGGRPLLGLSHYSANTVVILFNFRENLEPNVKRITGRRAKNYHAYWKS